MRDTKIISQYLCYSLVKMHHKLSFSPISDIFFIKSFTSSFFFYSFKKKKWNSISLIAGYVSFSFFLHYNYGLEGYQLNAPNYRMLQNWNIKLRLLFWSIYSQPKQQRERGNKKFQKQPVFHMKGTFDHVFFIFVLKRKACQWGVIPH